MTTRTFLYTLPSGTALPSTTGLPEGSPFVLNGTLHTLQSGTFIPVVSWTQITQAAYNALSPPVSGTLYIIVG